jgi:hypothetical protein
MCSRRWDDPAELGRADGELALDRSAPLDRSAAESGRRDR